LPVKLQPQPPARWALGTLDTGLEIDLRAELAL